MSKLNKLLENYGALGNSVQHKENVAISQAFLDIMNGKEVKEENLKEAALGGDFSFPALKQLAGDANALAVDLRKEKNATPELEKEFALEIVRLLVSINMALQGLGYGKVANSVLRAARNKLESAIDR